MNISTHLDLHIMRVDHEMFCAGSLVTTSGEGVPLCWAGSATDPAPRRYWIPPDHLLPYTEYLKRKPTGTYYSIGFKTRFKQGMPYLITDPSNLDKLSYNKPFRFESRGEALHFAQVSRLPVRSILLNATRTDVNNYGCFTRNRKRKGGKSA